VIETATLETGGGGGGGVTEVREVVDTDDTVSGEVEDDVGLKDIDMEGDVAEMAPVLLLEEGVWEIVVGIVTLEVTATLLLLAAKLEIDAVDTLDTLATLETGEDDEREVTEVSEVVDTDVTASGEVEDDVGVKDIDTEGDVADAGEAEEIPIRKDVPVTEGVVGEVFEGPLPAPDGHRQQVRLRLRSRTLEQSSASSQLGRAAEKIRDVN
jgi:hypothetical protein